MTQVTLLDLLTPLGLVTLVGHLMSVLFATKGFGAAQRRC